MRVTGCVFVLRWVMPSVGLRVRPEAPAVLGFGLDVGRDEGFGGGEDSRARRLRLRLGRGGTLTSRGSARHLPEPGPLLGARGWRGLSLRKGYVPFSCVSL